MCACVCVCELHINILGVRGRANGCASGKEVIINPLNFRFADSDKRRRQRSSSGCACVLQFGVCVCMCLCVLFGIFFVFLMTYRKDLLKAGTKIFEMRYASCVYELILLMRENVTKGGGGQHWQGRGQRKVKENTCN